MIFTRYAFCILFFLFLGKGLFAQGLKIEKIDCSEEEQKLYNDADKEIFYFYFSSGGMTPRTPKQAQKEKKFFNRYKNIKLINGGCVEPPCSSVYKTKKYTKMRNKYLNSKYGNQWVQDFPIHLAKFLMVQEKSKNDH